MTLIRFINELSFVCFPIIFNAFFTGSILLIGTLTANLMLKRGSAGIRFLLIFTALSSLLFLPLMTNFIESGTNSLSLHFKTELEIPANIQPENKLAFNFFEPQIILENLKNNTNHTSLTFIAWLFIIWVIGVVLIAIKICRGFFGMKLLMRATENEKTSSFKNLSIRVATHPKINIPVTCGLFNPLIILPEDYLNWPEEQKQAILCHEAAHVTRRDNITNFISQITTAIYWFNPLVWWAQNEMRINREKACDDYVLHTDIKPSSYAYILFNAIRAGKNCYFLKQESLVLNFYSKGENRLKYILDSTINHKILRTRAKILTFLIIVTLCIPLASFQLMAVKAQNDMPQNSQYWKDISFIFNGNQVKITLFSKNGRKIILSGPINEFPFSWPEQGIKNKVNTSFGPYFHPIFKQNRFHSGIDIASRFRTPIVASADGEVKTVSFWMNGYGKYIIIKHHGFSSLYAHLNEFKVKRGDLVKKGDLIGYSGNSGLTTGPHLHYEIRYNTQVINPKLFWAKELNKLVIHKGKN